MKTLTPILILFHFSLVFGQSAFDRSEARYDKCLMTDSTKTKTELEFQRTHARSSDEQMRYRLNRAEYYSHNNRLEEAEAELDKLAKRLAKNDSDYAARRVYLLSRIYYKMNRYRESNELIRTFLRVQKGVSNEWKLKVRMTSCENDIALGEYKKAHQTALEGYSVFRTKPSAVPDKVKITVFSTLYNTCFYQAKYDSALYYIFKEEPLLEDGTILKSAFYEKMAMIYTVTDRTAQAIPYYKKSIAILEKANVPMLLSYSYLNLGVCYKEVDPDKAIVSLERSLALGRATNYEVIIGNALQELGDLYLIRKDYVRAEKYNREALEILQRVGIDRGLANVLLNLGRSNFETGKYEEALPHLEEALVLMEKTDDVMMLGYCYEYLYKTYEHKGDYRLAFKYHKLYADNQRKVFKLDMQSNIEQMKISYDVRVEKATNKLLKKEVQLKNKKIAAERTVKWLLGGLLLILLIGAWFLWRLLVQRTRVKELELQLVQSELRGVEQEKERTAHELDTVKQQLIGKNALVGELNRLLVENEQNLISKEQLSTVTTNDADWVQFLAKLQVLFPQFAENLKGRHPNLSNAEFRLAALIRLNLSDKEISDLLFIELSSVKKAKNRLKQKLGLETGDKLDSYLGQL